MFIFGIYLPPYLARVISYLYNFLSGPVFISLPPGGTVSNGRAPSFPPLNLDTTRLVFIALHNISQYLLLTNMSGIISYLKSHSPSIYLYIHMYFFIKVSKSWFIFGKPSFLSPAVQTTEHWIWTCSLCNKLEGLTVTSFIHLYPWSNHFVIIQEEEKISCMHVDAWIHKSHLINFSRVSRGCRILIHRKWCKDFHPWFIKSLYS